VLNDSPPDPTEEEFMAGQFKCNCGNSFDKPEWLAFHRATQHLASTIVPLPKILRKRKSR
jgi:hypothetical protein